MIKWTEKREIEREEINKQSKLKLFAEKFRCASYILSNSFVWIYKSTCPIRRGERVSRFRTAIAGCSRRAWRVTFSAVFTRFNVRSRLKCRRNRNYLKCKTPKFGKERENVTARELEHSTSGGAAVLFISLVEGVGVLFTRTHSTDARCGSPSLPAVSPARWTFIFGNTPPVFQVMASETHLQQLKWHRQPEFSPVDAQRRRSPAFGTRPNRETTLTYSSPSFLPLLLGLWGLALVR